MKGWWYAVRYSNISERDVSYFICSDSLCNENLRWRVEHGERTAKELAEIGIASKVEVL